MPASVEAALDDRRRRGDVDAERFEHVRAAAAARDRAVAVLGDAHAARREHDRRDRRDVERVRAVAARAAGVEHRRVTSATASSRARAWSARSPTISAGRSPFIASADQQAGDLRRLRRGRP